jgi:hypothetical protein
MLRRLGWTVLGLIFGVIGGTLAWMVIDFLIEPADVRRNLGIAAVLVSLIWGGTWGWRRGSPASSRLPG